MGSLRNEKKACYRISHRMKYKKIQKWFPSGSFYNLALQKRGSYVKVFLIEIKETFKENKLKKLNGLKI